MEGRGVFHSSQEAGVGLAGKLAMQPTLHPDNDAVLAAAIEVHRHLGPGLLESTYKACLAYEFGIRGIRFRTEVPVPLLYKDTELDCGFRLDFLVNEDLVLEIKSVSAIEPIHAAQVMTYLRLTHARQAFLINFNSLTLKAGLRSYLRKGT